MKSKYQPFVRCIVKKIRNYGAGQLYDKNIAGTVEIQACWNIC
jgi:hypothetical protein